MHRKRSLQDALPRCQTSFDPSWLRDACAHMGGSWYAPNMDCEPVESEWLAKGNQEEVPHKSNSNYHEDATQRLALSLSPLVCLFTCAVLFFPLNKYFTCFNLFVFVGILSCKAKGPRPLSLATKPVASIWSPDVECWLIGKGPDAGKDWGREEKRATEDEMVRWHHPLNGHEFEQAPRDTEGQGSLACCSS